MKCQLLVKRKIINNKLAVAMGITAALLAAAPAHAVTTTILQPTSFAGWLSPLRFKPNSFILRRATGSITFSLPSVSTIQGLALWNDFDITAIKKFELFADTNSNVNDGLGTTLGTFTAAKSEVINTDPNADEPSFEVRIKDEPTEERVTRGIAAQTFSFTPISTQFIHLDIKSTHGQPNFAAAMEVAFEQSATDQSATDQSATRTPFEFCNIPVVVFVVTVGGINYFRNKKGGGKKQSSHTSWKS